MSWLWSKLTLRRELKGEEARHELLGYGRGGWEPLFLRLQERIEQQGGRAVNECSCKRNPLLLAAG